MQCQAKADEPEFADTRPWEDAPGFVSLRYLSTDVCTTTTVSGGCNDCQRECAYYAVDMRLDVFRRYAAVVLQYPPRIWCQLGGEHVMIPRPRNTASTLGRRSIEHLRHVQMIKISLRRVQTPRFGLLLQAVLDRLDIDFLGGRELWRRSGKESPGMILSSTSMIFTALPAAQPESSTPNEQLDPGLC